MEGVIFCPSFQQDTFQGKYKTVVFTEDLHHFPLGERRLREWERRFSLTNVYHCNVDCLKKWQENQDICGKKKQQKKLAIYLNIRCTKNTEDMSGKSFPFYPLKFLKL